MDNRNMVCPKCGAKGDSLDFLISGDMRDKDIQWIWECFECEYEWKTNAKGDLIND